MPEIEKPPHQKSSRSLKKVNLDRGLKKSHLQPKVRSFENNNLNLKNLDYDRPLKRVTVIKKSHFFKNHSNPPLYHKAPPFNILKITDLDFSSLHKKSPQTSTFTQIPWQLVIRSQILNPYTLIKAHPHLKITTTLPQNPKIGAIYVNFSLFSLFGRSPQTLLSIKIS